MCGIVGFLNDSRNRDVLDQTVRHMSESLHHRGPDADGTWCDADVGVALGHRRLSVIDLSSAGHQPMQSACGRYTIVYNGEVYNHKELRQELQSCGHQFRGSSDTECLLEAIARWDVTRAVERSNGMFAFGVWDAEQRKLTLVRDRLGIKPLYYGWMGGVFLFASELKSIRLHPAFRGEIDRSALSCFLRHNYVPAPRSIYTGIHKLPPGCLLTVSTETKPGQAAAQPYWSPAAAAERGRRQPFRGTVEKAVDELEMLLRHAVESRMVADVPLGAFLSGGIDSSIVVALMQAAGTQPVRTFSIGFEVHEYNEAPYAAAVARHLGTNHTEQIVTPADAREVIPRLPTLFDEPFADSSQIPTFLVSDLARRNVTVSLSGDGGDELFGGYERYRYLSSRWHTIGWIPQPIRRLTASALRAVGAISPMQRFCTRSHTLAGMLDVTDGREFYSRFNTHWRDPLAVVIGGNLPKTILTDYDKWPRNRNLFEQMMFVDTASYLPDDILVKVDRASMGVSLEARVPLLDHRVVEFAWSLPLEMKFCDGQGKHLLRKLLKRYLPEKLFDRPKTGFGIPIDAWLRGPLREWAESLLDERRLKDEGFFHPEPIRSKWDEHLTGRHDWHYLLWDILMFQQWHEAMAA